MKLLTGQYEFDENGNMTYWETSDNYWEKREFDENNNRNYYENSDGKIIDNRLKEISTEELTKLGYKLKEE